MHSKKEEEDQPAADKLHSEIQMLLDTMNSHDVKQKALKKESDIVKADVDNIRKKTVCNAYI